MAQDDDLGVAGRLPNININVEGDAGVKDRLYRSRENKVIAGVAGGLSEYFDVDVVIVRILFAVAALAGGSGVLAYIIAWIAVPEENALPAGDESFIRENKEYYGKYDKNEKESWSRKEGHRNAGLGFLLIALGILLLGRHFWAPIFYNFWPLLLIAAGIYLLVCARRGH